MLTNSVVIFDPEVIPPLTLFVSVILPVLVGLVTKTVTNSGVKAVLLALFAAVNGFLSEALQNSDGFDWQTACYTWLSSFVIAVATHYGLWKATGVAAQAQAVPFGFTGPKPKDVTQAVIATPVATEEKLASGEVERNVASEAEVDAALRSRGFRDGGDLG